MVIFIVPSFAREVLRIRVLHWHSPGQTGSAKALLPLSLLSSLWPFYGSMSLISDVIKELGLRLEGLLTDIALLPGKINTHCS